MTLSIKRGALILGFFFLAALSFFVPTPANAATCQTSSGATVTCYQGPDGNYYEGSSANSDADYWCSQGYSSYCSGSGGGSQACSGGETLGSDGNCYSAEYWCSHGYTEYCSSSGGGGGSGDTCSTMVLDGRCLSSAEAAAWRDADRIANQGDCNTSGGLECERLGDSYVGGVQCDSSGCHREWNVLTYGDGEPCGYYVEYYESSQLEVHTTIPENECSGGEGGNDNNTGPTDHCPNVPGVQSASSQCQEIQECPNGQVMQGGQCVPAPDCTSNGKGNPQTCGCPAGYMYQNNSCVATQSDVCPNISGQQGTVPFGYVSQNGQCVSACPGGQVMNSSGVCVSSCPTGYVLQGSSCVPATEDLCSNFSGTQLTVPNNCHRNQNGTCDANVGYTVSGNQCVPSDLCSNFAGAQTSVPANCHQETDGSCSANTGYAVVGNQCLPVSSSITVNGNYPATSVRTGSNVTVAWSVNNARSCTVKANGTQIGTGSQGSIAQVITAETVYTLTCTIDRGRTTSQLTQSVTANIIPTFEEI